LQPRARDTDRKNSSQGRSDLAEADHLGEMPKALAAMMFGTAYLAAIVAFSGVVYLRGLALVYADIVQYPILLGAMAGLGCLLIPLSRKAFWQISHMLPHPVAGRGDISCRAVGSKFGASNASEAWPKNESRSP